MVNRSLPIRLRKLIPARILNARAGYGSFIDIFLSDSNGNEIRAWIYQCDWSIEKNGSLEFSSDDFDKPAIPTMFSSKTLIDIEVNQDLSVVYLKFSEDITLKLEANPRIYGNDDLVIFFFGKGETISFDNTRGFYEECDPSCPSGA